MSDLCRHDFYLSPSFYKKLYRLAKVVNNVLIKNNIQYWAEAGTLIGVLRHKGIIPWDDDVDIKVWKKDWLKILSPEITEQFNKLGYTVVKEKGLQLIKVFPTKSKEMRSNYGFPFLDIFSVSLKDDKVVYTHKWARDQWPKDYLYIDQMYPLKYSKFGSSKIIIPNHSEEYLTRLFGDSWMKEGRIYQSHVLRIELDKPIIFKGPFVPAKDYDESVSLIEATKSLLTKAN